MKRISVLIVLFVLTLCGLSAQQKFTFNILDRFSGSITDPVHFVNDGFYIYGISGVYDGYTQKVEISKDKVILYQIPHGIPLDFIDNNRFFTNIYIPEKENAEIVIFSLSEDTYLSVPNGAALLSTYWEGRFLAYYQNGISFLNLSEWREERDANIYHTATYDEKTGAITEFLKKYRPFSLSPDKIWLLGGYGNQAQIYNIQQKSSRVLGKEGQSSLGAMDYSYMNQFISNFLIMGRKLGEGSTSPRLQVLYDINGNYLGDFSFFVSNGQGGNYLDRIKFSDDFTHAILVKPQGNIYVVDSTPFRDYLDRNNLLFRHTTAVSTESRVRIRENPNLEAQTFGYLEKGDELEVTDRSGIQVQIGDMNDWWYKIKRKSDGLTGWAYGYFLKLASYQGELGPKPNPAH